jgi:NifU-like protein involved in Fe-S cluster formation
LNHDDIVDRWQNPLYNVKPGVDLTEYAKGEFFNPMCGDTCTIYARVAGGVVIDCLHETKACTITTCCADLLCEARIGHPVDFEINLFEILGIAVGVNRRMCVITPERAFDECSKHLQSPPE